MKKLFVFIIIGFASSIVAQDQLINTHLISTTVYGGAKNSGIKTNYAYTFVAQSEITLLYVLLENASVILKKDDSLIVSWSTFSPYANGNEPDWIEDDTIVFSEPEKFYARKINGLIYINFEEYTIWAKAITYLYKGREYTAKTKSEFDSENKYYAP